MKFKRTKKNYGSGSGRVIFESDLFKVVVWHMDGGIKTTIDVRHMDYYKIDFDGKYDFTSDELCMEQLTVDEIKNMIVYERKLAFEEGRQSKINEIKNCLEL